MIESIYKKEWEKIDGITERLIVPGGWIVRSRLVKETVSGVAVSIHQVFISDPSYEWKFL